MNQDFSQLVYNCVRIIPLGKVTTFSQIAIVCGEKKSTKKVIKAIKNTPNPVDLPVHRVVCSSGRLAPYYVFGNKRWQKRQLLLEGVEINKGKVDLSKYGFIYW